MKKNAGFLIALALLAVVGGSVAYLMVQDEQTAKDVPPSETRLFKDDLPKLSSVAITRSGEEAVRLQSEDGSNWSIVEPRQLAADPFAVSEMLGNLRTLDAERILEAPGGDLAPYGLEEPFLRIALTEGESQRELRFGALNPTGSARYATLGGIDKLYLIAIASVNTLNKTLAELRRKRVFTVSELDAKSIRIQGAGATRELVRNGVRNWTFASPEGFSADQTMIGTFASSVLNTQVDAAAFATEPMSASRFTGLPLVANVTVEGSKTTESSEFRRAADGTVYVQSDGVGGIFPVRLEFETYLKKPLEEYRNLKLFSFGFADIFRLRYEAGEKKFTLAKPNDDWNVDGTTVDAVKANRLVDELRSATATSFVEGTPPGAVTHSIEVESGDGTKERVEFYGEGDARFAVRVGEKGYYKLPENVVPDIEKAAAELKP